jgi:hypothetical protein
MPFDTCMKIKIAIPFLRKGNTIIMKGIGLVVSSYFLVELDLYFHNHTNICATLTFL